MHKFKETILKNQEDNIPGSIHSSIMSHSYRKLSNELSDITEETDDPPFSFTSPIFREEIKINLKMALPLMAINILQYLLTVETTSISGRLTTEELAGTVLALSLIQALGWSVCGGFVSACDTLMSQAYGSENKKRTGLFLQRSILALNILPFIIWSLHVNFEPILIGLGQQPNISRISAEFIIHFIPGIMFMLNYMILARYMQNQGCFLPAILAAFCGNVFNICSQLLFVTYLGFGYKAGAVCFCLSYVIMFLIELVYLLVSKFYIPTWSGFEWEAFYDWKQMITLGIAGMAHTSFEVIIWEASVFMGGLLGNVQLATNSILIQILSMLFLIYFGAGIASNIRVGQCLGANRPNQAKFAYRAASAIIVSLAVVLTIIVISIRQYVPYIFTNQEEVISLITDTIPILSVLFLSDPLSGVCIGCLRGCGRQLSGAVVLFISFYAIALPMSIILTFIFQFDVKGIWIGNTCGSLINVTCNLLILECQNWDKQALAAQNRLAFSTFNRKRLNTTKQSESESLLPQKSSQDPVVDNAVSSYTFPSHIRTPSNPISCSIEYVPMPPPRLGKLTDLKMIVLNRIVIYLSIITLFIGCILIHVFLPTELYRPQNNTHN